MVVGGLRWPRPMFESKPMFLDLLGKFFCFLKLALTGGKMPLVRVMVCADPLTAALAVIIQSHATIEHTFQRTRDALNPSAQAKAH